MTNATPDTVKARTLRKHKTMATGLFLLMVVVYVACTWYQQIASPSWIGYVKAFAEAAMVGALADWFAVTALFHHPLGIPIPHTNLIENRKKSIGDNLGGFVVSNFLNASTIRPYIQKLQVSNFAARWLSKEKNQDSFIQEIAWLLKDVIKKMDDAAVVKFLSHKSITILNNLKLNEVLASGLHLIIERGDQERILNYILKKVHRYVINNDEIVKKKVKEESHFLIPGFVDNIIATKITKGASRYLTEIQQDPQHKIRMDFNRQLTFFIDDVRNNPAWQQELQQIKNSLLSGDKINEYARDAWRLLQESILVDLTANRSAVKAYLRKTLHELAQNLQNDRVLRSKIDNWIRHKAYRYILQNTRTAGHLISHTVGNWKGRELSNKLELEVGKDLQFIRVNGTLVGGLVGLLIYIITKLITA